MKKILAMSLALLMMLSVTACSNDKPAVDTSTDVSESVTDTGSENVTPEDPSTDVVDPSEDVGTEVTIDSKIEKMFTDVKAKLGDNYLPSMPIDEMYLNEIMGVNMDDVDSFYGEVPMMSAQVDTLVVVKAVEGKVEAVKAALDARANVMKEDTMQYPSNLPVIQETVVGVEGDYVYYICMAGDTTAEQEQGEAAVAEVAKNVCSSVVEVIKATVAE